MVAMAVAMASSQMGSMPIVMATALKLMCHCRLSIQIDMEYDMVPKKYYFFVKIIILSVI